MNNLSDLWNLFVTSNTFNFVVMVAIFCVILKKINISEVLENLRLNIIDSIESVKNNKISATENLAKAKDSVKNIDAEIRIKLDGAKETAQSICDTILENTDKRIILIQENTTKSISSEEKSLSAKLTEKAAQAALAIAKNHIIHTLKDRPNLHSKYIDESIQELDRIQF